MFKMIMMMLNTWLYLVECLRMHAV